jgi:hypothetical protein
MMQPDDNQCLSKPSDCGFSLIFHHIGDGLESATTSPSSRSRLMSFVVVDSMASSACSKASALERISSQEDECSLIPVFKNSWLPIGHAKIDEDRLHFIFGKQTCLIWKACQLSIELV